MSATETIGSEIERRAPVQMIVAPTPTDDEIRRMYRIAEGLAASGVYKDARQAAQAFAKILVGRDLGLSAAQSMSAIQFVEGNIQTHYAALGMFVRARPGYNYKVVQLGNESVSIDFTVNGESVGVSTFTQEDAKKAGLDRDRGSQKSNFVKYPRNMLLARAMSNGCKWFVPEVLSGLPVYVEGEIPPALDPGAGDGDGSAPGVDLGPKVEAIIARAKQLGHAGYSDRATIEMTLGRRSPAVVNQWVAAANEELDRIEAEQPVDAEVVDEGPGGEEHAHREAPTVTPDAEKLARMYAEADDLLEQSQAAGEEGDEDRAALLEQAAFELRDEADALEGQGSP